MKQLAISSSDNSQFKHWRKLAESSRACRLARRSLAEGIHLAEVLLTAPVAVDAVIVRAGLGHGEALAMAQTLAIAKGAVLVELAAPLYQAIAPVDNGTGPIVEFEIPASEWPQRAAVDAVYLAGLQEPGNVGTLIRTAAAAGVRHVLASAETAYVWSPKVLRAGMGAHFAVQIHEGVAPESIGHAFAAERLAADATGGRDLYAEDWGQGPTVWMLGSEGAGLSPAALAVAQRRLFIPIDSAVESLNVGAAAAICLFEQRRRRTR
ncbi:MAG: RNA methyltransferase [Burkholderiaceae bacterium]